MIHGRPLAHWRRIGLLLAGLAWLAIDLAPGQAAPVDPPSLAPAAKTGPAEPAALEQSAAEIPEPGGYRLARSYQSSPEVPLGVIEDPAGISVAADGTVFVTDRALHRAQRFEADGRPLQAYGKPGDGPGDLYFPSGVAVDLERDRVYIGDSENNRVAIFHLDGSFEANWGPYELPEAIAVGLEGRVYIFEGKTGAIRIRDSEGKGDGLIEPGAYLRREPGIAGGLAIGPGGDVYVAMNLGVRKYSPDGDLLGNGAPKIYPSGAPITRGVTFDARGRIYILEENRLRYAWTGGIALPVAVGLSVRGIAAGEAGTLYMIVPKSRDLPAGVLVRRFENGRQTDVRRWGIPQTVLGWLNQPLRLDLGAGGALYVVDDLRRVQRFDPALTRASGQLVMPGLIEVAPIDARSFVVARTRFGSSADDPDDADRAPPAQQAARTERYDLPGPLTVDPPAFESLTAAWRHETIDDIVAGDASRVQGLAVDAGSGRSWQIDAGKSQLVAFAPDGPIERQIDLPEVNAGFPAWSDLAIAADGSILALHTAARKLYRFDARDGRLLGELEIPEYAWRVAVGPGGDIFLPTARRWIWRLDAGGRPTALWQLPAPAYGDPQPPSDLAVGEDDTVYVLDQGSSAIYAFEPQDGLPGEGLPEPGRLRCDVEVSTEADPPEVELGQPVAISLRIGGSCAPHQRTQERPSLLLRSGEISLTLPAEVTLVAGSDEPPARQQGQVLSWRLGQTAPAGSTLRFELQTASPGRFEIPSAGGIRYLDGWFDFGRAAIDASFFYTLIPPTPTPPPLPTEAPRPRLLLPWLQRS